MPVPDARISTFAAAEEREPVGLPGFPPRDDQQRLGTALQRVMDCVEGRAQFVLRDRFFEIGYGSQSQAAAAILDSGDDMNGNVARFRVVLQPVEDGPAGHVGQVDVERDGAGLELAGQRQRRVAAESDQGPNAPFPRKVEKNPGERGIVLDN